MDCLAGTLVLCTELRQGLERGDSILIILKESMSQLDSQTKIELRKFFGHIEQFQQSSPFSLEGASIFKENLYILVEMGIRGESIHKRLVQLEKEILDQCELDIQKFLNKLPIQAAIPLFLFQFPAFLILILGPIVTQLLKELSQ